MKIDNIEFYRPSEQAIILVEEEAQEFLLSKYQPGTYSDSSQIIEILNEICLYYLDKLEHVIFGRARKDWLVLSLYQYEISGIINKKYYDGTLTTEEEKYWYKNGPLIRQVADFLCEKIVENFNDSPELEYQPIDYFKYDVAFNCCERIVSLANLSNLFHTFEPDDIELIIYEKGVQPYLDCDASHSNFIKCLDLYRERSRRDIPLRKSYTLEKEFEFDHELHYKYLDDPFQNHTGLMYSDIHYILFHIYQNTHDISEPGLVPMVDVNTYFAPFADSLDISKTVIHRALSGLVLTKEQFLSQSRQVWNPKQENRVSRRPFLQVEYGGKIWLLWSKAKLNDFVTLLSVNLIFKTLPTEWGSKKITASIERLSNAAGKWFERIVIENMSSIGFDFRTFERKIQEKGQSISIPKTVGGFDALCYSKEENMLILLECKMIKSSFEGRGFGQEKSKYLDTKKGFVVKLTKKTRWLKSHFQQIANLLTQENRESEEIGNVATAIVSYYANVAPCFVKDFPCVTLPELIEAFREKGRWPFTIGIL